MTAYLFRHITSKLRLLSIILLLSGVFLFNAFLPIKTAGAVTLSPPRLELAGDPGTVISSEIKITNEATEPQVYYTQVENFEAADESGNPSFVPTRENLATWVDVAANIRVEAGQQKVLPFTIRIPQNAEPGGYFASLFIRTTPPPTRGGEVSIGARLGTLLLLRVNGDIQEGVDILEFGTKDNQRFFSSLPIDFYYRFQNTGADRVKPTGTIAVKNVFGMNAKILNANRSDGSVLPRSIRRFESSWITSGGGEEAPELQSVSVESQGFFAAAVSQAKNFAFGYYTANLDITFGESNNTAHETFRFFIIPWQLLIIGLVVLVVLFVVLRFILKRYNRYIISKYTR